MTGGVGKTRMGKPLADGRRGFGGAVTGEYYHCTRWKRQINDGHKQGGT